LTGDLEAGSIEIDSAGNLTSRFDIGDGYYENVVITLRADNHFLTAASDFVISGNRVTRQDGSFDATLASRGDTLDDLWVTSTANGVTVTENPLEREGFANVHLEAYGDLHLDASIVIGQGDCELISYGSIIAGSDVEGAHISSAGYVYLESGQYWYSTPAECRIASFENPLTVKITGDGALYLAAYGEVEGISAVLTGETPTMAITQVIAAPGEVYFNLNLVEPPAIEPETPPVEHMSEPSLADTGRIIATLPLSVSEGDLTRFQFNSLLGTVYFYHPILTADMAAFGQFNLEAGAYRLENGALGLVGHEGVLQFFEEFDRLWKEKAGE
jgi:hypothetical protein